MNRSHLRLASTLTVGICFGLFAGVARVNAAVIFVRADAIGNNDGTSWEDAYTDLQDALAASGGVGFGDQIWVAAATYTPDGPAGARSATFQLVSGVGLYGGFVGSETDLDQRDPDVNVTILSGDLNADDGDDFANNDENSYNVVTASGTSDTLLDGFTIIGGNANGGDPPHYYGGAVVIDNEGATLRTCRITRNDGQYRGAVYNTGLGLQIHGCVFKDNMWIGVENSAGIGLTITDSLFEGHEYSGIQINSGTVSITGCTFTDNATGDNIVAGGGISNNSDNLVVTNCSFTRHGSSDEGGAFNNCGENLSLINCAFFDNDGLAMWNNVNEVTIVNSTFIDDAFFTYGGDLTINNSIFWSDDPSDGEDDLINLGWEWDSTLIVNNSIVRGWTGKWGGTDNNGDDPLFADADGRLSRGSPAVDTGANDAVPEDLTIDLDGHPRFSDGDGDSQVVVDRGAYELPCEGDANGDGLVDPLDSGFVLARFGCPVGTGDPSCDMADQNGDGVVDPLDGGFVLARFGDCQ